eukprot:s1985_g8.t3
MASGPCGGVAGAAPRGGKGPGQRRMLLKGLRLGAHVSIRYREKEGPGVFEERLDFEGTIADKRVGWDNRESYVELKECLRLNRDGEIIELVGKKQLYDAFIEEVEVVEKTERRLSAELRAAQQAKAKAKKALGAPGAVPAAQTKGEDSDSDDGPVPGMLPGMMFGMGPMGMGMMPMGMPGMPMGIGMGFMPPMAMAMPVAMPGMAMMPGPMGCPAIPAACVPGGGAPPKARSRSRSRVCRSDLLGSASEDIFRTRCDMATYSPYPGPYPGRRNPASKAPQGWSAAMQSRRYEEEALAPVDIKREAVADRASSDSAGGGGGGGGGGAKLPFMIQNLYLSPGKVGPGAAYTMTRLQPQDVEKPSWAK